MHLRHVHAELDPGWTKVASRSKWWQQWQQETTIWSCIHSQVKILCYQIYLMNCKLPTRISTGSKKVLNKNKSTIFCRSCRIQIKIQFWLVMSNVSNYWINFNEKDHNLAKISSSLFWIFTWLSSKASLDEYVKWAYFRRSWSVICLDSLFLISVSVKSGFRILILWKASSFGRVTTHNSSNKSCRLASISTAPSTAAILNFYSWAWSKCSIINFLISGPTIEFSSLVDSGVLKACEARYGLFIFPF